MTFSVLFSSILLYEIFLATFAPWVPLPVSSDAIIHKQPTIHSLEGDEGFKVEHQDKGLQSEHQDKGLQSAVYDTGLQSAEEQKANQDISGEKIDFDFENPTNCTMVTTYFDIGRKGRGPDYYLGFLQDTLSLPAPFVVYTQKKFMDKVKAIPRPEGMPTVYIEMELEELPYYHYIDRVREILSDPNYYSQIRDNFRPECTYDLYAIIQFSKFPLILRAAKEKLWPGGNYVWMDAGASRLFGHFDITKPWNTSRLQDKLAVKYFRDRSYVIDHILKVPIKWDILVNNLDLDKMAWESVAVTAGTMFGGSLKAFQNIEPEIEKVWVERFLDRGIVNNEQMAMLILSLQKPSLFDLVVHADMHEPFYLNGKTYPSYWGFRDFLRYLRGDNPVSPYPLTPCDNYILPCA